MPACELLSMHCAGKARACWRARPQANRAANRAANRGCQPSSRQGTSTALGLGLAAVAGVAVVDLACARALSRRPPAPAADYSGRSGWPLPPADRRSAALEDFEPPRDRRILQALRPWTAGQAAGEGAAAAVDSADTADPTDRAARSAPPSHSMRSALPLSRPRSTSRAPPPTTCAARARPGRSGRRTRQRPQPRGKG